MPVVSSTAGAALAVDGCRGVAAWAPAPEADAQRARGPELRQLRFGPWRLVGASARSSPRGLFGALSALFTSPSAGHALQALQAKGAVGGGARAHEADRVAPETRASLGGEGRASIAPRDTHAGCEGRGRPCSSMARPSLRPERWAPGGGSLAGAQHRRDALAGARRARGGRAEAAALAAPSRPLGLSSRPCAEACPSLAVSGGDLDRVEGVTPVRGRNRGSPLDSVASARCAIRSRQSRPLPPVMHGCCDHAALGSD